jgi:tol-pal system protein YbgF
MKLKSSFITASLIAVVWATPAAAADKEQRQMMADLRMLQEQAQQLQNMIQTLTASLGDAIKSAETRLNARIDAQSAQTEQTRKALADQGIVVGNIQNDLRSVREKLDDNTTRVGSLKLEVEALRQLITQRGVGSAVPGGADSGIPGIADAAAPQAAAPAGAVSLGASPSKIFDAAMSDYYKQDYELAREGFSDYIKTYPDSVQAPEAQYWICNSFVNEGQYQKAVDACDTAIRNYPKSAVLAEAYYKKGLAHQSLGQNDRAIDAYNTVVTKYPDSDTVTLAAQGLQRLKK